MKELIEFLKTHESTEEVTKEINRLTTLNIEKFYQKDKIKELIEFLKTHEFTEEVKQLTTLNVDGGSDSGEAILGNTNIVSLSEALKNNDTITSLDLRRNEIGDAGVIKIVESLENNNTITSLGFSSNDITDIGIKKISELLKHNNITSLELNYDEVTDKGSAIIVEALNSNTSLTKLFLGANNIKDATIIEALKYNILTSLTLNANYIANNRLLSKLRFKIKICL